MVGLVLAKLVPVGAAGADVKEEAATAADDRRRGDEAGEHKPERLVVAILFSQRQPPQAARDDPEHRNGDDGPVHDTVDGRCRLRMHHPNQYWIASLP